MTILTSLPDSWDAFIRAIDPTDLLPPAEGQQAKLTSAKLIARILQEDRRLKQRTADSETALIARNAHDESRFTCFNCSRHGHKQDKCRTPPASAEQRARIQQSVRQSRSSPRSFSHRVHVTEMTNTSASTRDDSRDNSEPNTQVFRTVWVADDTTADGIALAAEPDAWYLNSGATLHVCKDRINFFEYSETPGKTVKGVGGHPVPQLGRSTVPLVSHIRKQAHYGA
ncbi:hypothetical protein BN946_scf185042.g49 [Trametes cinnabarina]|uniref:CCHC-type domain-containing protein n=1 Tax=Pycnoporus cinnabarinus TaxID=5643 RepID=A0A060S3Z2_PYCCI|nr:hypothetical protein BN946_scf185042.g49 [Trametes cinnabarina]